MEKDKNVNDKYIEEKQQEQKRDALCFFVIMIFAYSVTELGYEIEDHFLDGFNNYILGFICICLFVFLIRKYLFSKINKNKVETYQSSTSYITESLKKVYKIILFTFPLLNVLLVNIVFIVSYRESISDYPFYGFIIFCALVYIIRNIISNKYRTYNCICLLIILSSFYIINYIYDDNKNLENYSITIKELAEEKHLEYGYMCISSEDETKLDVKLDKNIKYKITFSKYGIKDIYVGNDIKYYYINRFYYKELEDYYNDDRYHESDNVILNKVDYNCN